MDIPKELLLNKEEVQLTLILLDMMDKAMPDIIKDFTRKALENPSQPLPADVRIMVEALKYVTPTEDMRAKMYDMLATKIAESYKRKADQITYKLKTFVKLGIDEKS